MDHETSGAQEWQLPGYGRKAPSRPVFSSVAGPATLSSRTTTKPETQKQLPSATPVASSSSKNPGPARGGFRGRSQGRGSKRARGSPSKPGPQSSRLFQDSPAKSKWRNGVKHTGLLKLPAPFGTFKHEFSGAARGSTLGKRSGGTQGRNEVFEDISQKTGAYVKPPTYNDQVIYIWGEPAHVAAAEEILRGLIVKCNSFSQKKKAEFAKVQAYSVSKEANAEFKEKREVMIQQLRKAPDSFSAFPEQLIFLWPRDGPSLNESLGPQLEALDIIRESFGCPLFVPKDLPGYICALGNNHDVMKQIAQRIRTLWGEIIAKSNIKSKVYIVQPPEPDAMKSKIIVKKQVHIHKPALRGNRLKGPELGTWKDRASLIQTKDSARILNAAENSLRGVSFVRGHLRLRVNFGSFVLDNYQAPTEDKAWYRFEEFREMLFHEQTKGRLIPGLKVGQRELLERCFKANEILEPYDRTSNSLKNAEPAYSVNFEFLGTDKSMLRLEAEYSKSPGAGEYEITQRRWLRPRSSGESGDKRPPLQVSVIDFGRSDWQLEIKSLEFYETNSIDAALKSFSHSIGFRNTANVKDISASPERKVVFPASAPVSRFVEKSAIRYRLKGTKYILEIARYDEYSRVESAFSGQSVATMSGPISDVPRTSWGASIFDPNWDILFGGHANLPVGHSAKYLSTIQTFFPARDASNIKEKCTGFWELINLVKQVAELLGPTRIPSGIGRGMDERMAPSNADSSSGSWNMANSGKPPSGASSPTSATGSTTLLNQDLGTLF